MSLINVSSAVLDPRLSQAFQIKRFVGGHFSNEGQWLNFYTIESRFGSIQPATEKDKAEFLPEGERSGEMIKCFCAQDLQMTDGNGQESDIIIWEGREYRVAFAKPWHNFGYWFVVAEGIVTPIPLFTGAAITTGLADNAS